MASLQPVRGTHDLLPDDKRRHRHVEETALEICGRYGFAEVSTPIFEFTEVFSRTLGDTSDIVTKEMYSFDSGSGDSITLRPEGTAGIARAFIANKLVQELPLKLVYRGPMFRRERPQKGRQRQFHQVGIELLGVESPLGDVEVIAMAAHVLEALGLGDKVTLELNSLGDAESRHAYRAVLLEYLRDHHARLSDDSRERLERNPLRVLDSKDDDDKGIVAGAPLLVDSFNEASRVFFEQVRAGLEIAGVPHEVNPRLVRGLDYYCHTAFEFTTTALGAQGTVLAGGRYDGLIQQMGGPATPGTGWAAGVERLALLIGEPPAVARPIAVIPVSVEQGDAALALVQRLRHVGFRVDFGYSGGMKKRIKRADKVGASASVLLGPDEMARGAATVRDMASGLQSEVPLDTLEDHLSRYR